MAKSASLPIEIVPFRGYKPYFLAGVVEMRLVKRCNAYQRLDAVRSFQEALICSAFGFRIVTIYRRSLASSLAFTSGHSKSRTLK